MNRTIPFRNQYMQGANFLCLNLWTKGIHDSTWTFIVSFLQVAVTSIYTRKSRKLIAILLREFHDSLYR